MEIKTHVLTNEQHLNDTQKLTARKNIGIKVEDVKNSAGESLVDEQGVVTIPDGVAVDPELSPTSTNPVQNKVVTAALNGKVDKVAGKDLSTNDYTTAEKDKLAGIEAGAEVNVQVDWEQTQSDSDDFIKNKPENLVQDPDYVHTDNNYTDAEKAKLGTVSEGANKVEASQINGNIKIDAVETTVYEHPTTTAVTAAAVKVGNDTEGHVVLGDPLVKGDVGLGNVDNTSDEDKPISTATQTALDLKVDKEAGKGLSTNDFTDAYKDAVDANTLARHTHANQQILDGTTASYTSEEQDKLSGISNGANKVEASQTNGNIKIDNVETPVYTHPTTEAVTAAAVKVGNDTKGHVVIGDPLDKGDVGLGNVNNTSDLDKPISIATQAALDLKVDKVEGKGLSTNDFTDAYKNAVDDNTLARHTHANQQILDDTTASYTIAEKNKLGSIEPGAQVNVIETVKVDGEALTVTDKAVDIDLTGKEDKSNKTTSWGQELSDTKYPSEKLVKNSLDSKVDKEAGKGLVVEPDPNTPSTILGYRGDGTSDSDPDWRVIAKSTFGASPEILDEQTGEPIVDDDGEPILDETATDLWATYDGTGFGAERAVADRAGNVIDETYATKTDIANKADKVSGATSGNFASLTVSGNLADSGYDATDFVQSVVDSQTNGNIVVDGTEINVYTHPEPDPRYPQYSKKLYKVSVDLTGHVITDANSSLRPTEATDEDIANTGIFDSTYAYNTATNKGATVAHVTNAVSTAINALDNTASSDTGNNVQVTVTQEDGVVTAVSVSDNSINANDIVGKADKVSGATAGNFAGLNASGNLTDSGSKASDFATAAQGNKADTAIQGVQKNGTDLTPDANKKVNVVVNNATLTVTVGSSSPVEFSADASQNKSVTIPLASFDKTTEPKQYGEGLMTGQEKEKLNDIETGAQANVIEKVQKNGTELTITNKTVNVVVNDGKLKTKIGSAASATNLFSADASTDATLEIPLASVDNTGVTPVYSEGLMSASDKEKLEGIEAGAEENDVETISIGGGTPIAPTTNTTNIDIPLADFDDTGAQTTYTDGAMSGEDKEKLNKLKNFSKVTISDGAATVDCEPIDEKDTMTFVAGTNITLTKTQGSNEVTIDAAGGTTVSAGRSISIIETPTATGTDYEVSVDGAVGYYGSMTTINNITTSPTDLLDASATPNVNSGNDRFIVALNSTDNHVYLYALKTVKDALDPTNDVAGVDVFTLSFNVQVHRTQAHGFYGMAGVQLVRDSSSAIVLHSSTESYPSNVGECSVNGSTTVWNNAGTTTTITDPVTHESKDYYGYRLIYVGDTSLGVSDTIQVDARFSVVENMSGTAEYTGSITQYTGGSAIEIDANTHEVSVRPGGGLVVDTSTNTLAVNVKADGGIRLYSDGLGVSLGLDEVTEEVVDTVQEISSDMASKLTTNFPYPMITDVSYDFGSLNIGGSCICQLFSVPFRHPIVVDETYVMIYIKDRGYSQSNVMFGIYQYDPAGNNNTGKTDFICDTGAVSIAKPTSEKDILEFPIKHVNSDVNFRALRPDCMYYAVLAMPPNAGSGIFLASAPNYNDTVNSMPTLNWRITNCSNITWNDPTNATLDETQVNWWDSGYNEHESMNRFFMQIRNHVPQNNNNNGN